MRWGRDTKEENSSAGRTGPTKLENGDIMLVALVC